MVDRFEDIAKEVLELSRHQRLMLIRLLLDQDRSDRSTDVDNAWDAEIRARVKAVDEGRAVGIPYEQIKRSGPTGEALIKAMQASPDREVSIESLAIDAGS